MISMSRVTTLSPSIPSGTLSPHVGDSPDPETPGEPSLAESCLESVGAYIQLN